MPIRRLTLKDTAELYALITVSRSSLKNLVWAEGATFESTAKFIYETNAKLSPNELWAVTDGVDEDSEIAGCIELRDFPDRVQVGYWLGTPFRGRHLLHNALVKVRDYYFEYVANTRNHKPLTAMIHPENIASQKILTYAGLVKEYTTRDERGVWDHYHCRGRV